MIVHRRRDYDTAPNRPLRRCGLRRRLPLAVLLLSLVALLPACAADRSHDDVRALTEAFFNALRSGHATEAASLVLQSSGPIWPLINSVSEQKSEIPSYTIEDIHEIDAREFRVIVVVPGKTTTTTITLVARKSGKVWRFNPDIQVESRFNGMASVSAGSGALAE